MRSKRCQSKGMVTNMNRHFDEERGLLVDENGFVDPLDARGHKRGKFISELEQWSEPLYEPLDDDDIALLSYEDPYMYLYRQEGRRFLARLTRNRNTAS